MFAIILKEEELESVDVLAFPEMCEIGWGGDGVDLHVVLVVFVVGVGRIVHEAEPETPAVVKQGVHHLLHGNYNLKD